MGYIKLSLEQERCMVEDYRQGAPIKQLLEKYGFKSKKSVTDKVKKHFPNEYKEIIEEARMNRKGYTYSFQKIKNNFDAYFIGLLLTDGYVLSDREGVGIDMTDEDVIAFLSSTIGTKYSSYKSEEGHKTRYRMVISDPSMLEGIGRFGLTRKKSLTLEGPNLLPEEEKFLPYLIRGIIDGDGCVSKTSYEGTQFYICTGSKSFADWLIYILENKFFMVDIHSKQNEDGVWRIETANQRNILKLIATVYDRPYGMSRKYDILRKTFRDYNKDILLG